MVPHSDAGDMLITHIFSPLSKMPRTRLRLFSLSQACCSKIAVLRQQYTITGRLL